jgi:hypothetical protein
MHLRILAKAWHAGETFNAQQLHLLFKMKLSTLLSRGLNYWGIQTLPSRKKGKTEAACGIV